VLLLYTTRSGKILMMIITPTGGVPAWLAQMVKDRASCERHHKVKRRALQLVALPVLKEDPNSRNTRASTHTAAGIKASESSAAQAAVPDGDADAKLEGKPVSLRAAETQQRRALEEVQALQGQLKEAQHPEVCCASCLICACLGRIPLYTPEHKLRRLMVTHRSLE